MNICPWCGTNNGASELNCRNCGGPLTEMKLEASDSFSPSEEPPMPPPAPRPISHGYAWHLLLSDAWMIAVFVFGLLGFIFSVVGAGLMVSEITAFVGRPFLLFGLAFLVPGVIWFWSRYRNARKTVSVLRDGDSVRGQIIDLRQSYHLRINGRYPWIIDYEYIVNGQTYEGKLSMLNPPGPRLRAGNAVSVLYLASDPARSSLYPRP